MRQQHDDEPLGDWDWLYADESVGGPSIPVAVMPSFPPSKDSTYNRDVDRIRKRVIEDVNDENVKSDVTYDAESSNVSEPMTLPKSTHTLLFSEPMCSFPFIFAIVIALVCFSCLGLALVNNLFKEAPGGWNNPNLARSVRASQYLAILIAMMMESEIPTGLMLLRNISSQSFHAKLPKSRSYSRFVASAILRIILGYLFLINVFVVLMQAKEVLEIFYNILALEFLIQLDDITFVLSKMDVLGKHMRLACTSRIFHMEFDKVKHHNRGYTGLCLKSIYFANIVVSLMLLTTITIGQRNGYFQCRIITIDLGDGVWEDPILDDMAREHNLAVLRPPPGTNDTKNDFTLVFSYFNGVYEQDGTHRGRPVYRERRKFDNKPFDSTWGTIPAEIRYSNVGDFWIFTHPWIRKSGLLSTEDDVSSKRLYCFSPRRACLLSYILHLYCMSENLVLFGQINYRTTHGYFAHQQRRSLIY
jgi:hypothetical protein